MDESSQFTLNLFPELTTAGSRTQAALYSTPGLVPIGSSGSGLPCRSNGCTFKGITYFISGNSLIGVSALGTIATYGTLTGPYETNRCSLVGGVSYLLIIDDMGNGYTWTGPGGGAGCYLNITATGGQVTGTPTFLVEGSGYFVGDVLGLTAGDGTATAYVDNVDIEGGILAVTLRNAGTTGYVTGTTATTNLSPGQFRQITTGFSQGSGCTLTVVAGSNTQATAYAAMGLTSVNVNYGGSFLPSAIPLGLVNGYAGQITVVCGVQAISFGAFNYSPANGAFPSPSFGGTGAGAGVPSPAAGMASPTITNAGQYEKTAVYPTTLTTPVNNSGGAIMTASFSNSQSQPNRFLLTSITVDSPGSYTSQPTISIVTPTGTNMQIQATAVAAYAFSPSNDNGSGKRYATINGTGYSADATCSFGGIAATVYLTVVSATVNTPGTYMSFPTITLSSGGITSIFAVCNVSGISSSSSSYVSGINGGTGYASNPTGSFSVGSATITLGNNGTNATLTSFTGGAYYTSYPVITISAPAGNTSIGSATPLAGGSNYLLNDILQVGTGNGRFKVTSINSNGAVLDGSVLTAGTGYANGVYATTDLNTTFFPPATHCTWQDGYYIVVAYGTNKFYISDIDNPTSGHWQALNFAGAEEIAGVDYRVESCLGMVTIIGANGAQTFYEAGNANFPFTPVLPNGIFEWGLGAIESEVKCDDSLIWLAQNQRGDLCFVQLTGLAIQIIGNRDIDQLVNSLGTTSDAFAFFQRKAGHSFYIITFPTADMTLCYDLTNQKWHNRNTAGYNSWRAAGFGYNNGQHIIGDRFSDTFYLMKDTTYTDNGLAITRERIGPVFAAEGQRIEFNRFEVLMETGEGLQSGQGANPLIMLSWSDDGGHSWSDFMTGSMGAVGQHAWRVIWNMLGSSYGRTFKLMLTDPVPCQIMGAWMDVSGGLPMTAQYQSRGSE